MISVLSRLRQLNGSSLIGFLFLGLLLSCSTPKSGTKRQPDTTQPSGKDDDDYVRVYDPETGTYVLVPRDAVKVDTVEWKQDKADPILTDKTPESDTETPGKKSQYTITLLLPLDANKYPDLSTHLDSRLLRFLHYYGGMRIAAEQAASMGLPVKFHAFDTELSLSKLNSILEDPAVRKSDVIVGPYDKEYLESVAEYGKENEKFVISPWLPAFTIDERNPYFIQIVPGLGAHASAIMDFVGDTWQNKKIFLVARNNPNEIQRLGIFKKDKRIRTEDLIIDDESIELADTDLGFLLDDPDGTVFILPYYSRQDETFVNSFMRKLHADKGSKEVTVFGLPQWTGFDLNSNYMESLSLHISSHTHTNTGHSDYRRFRNKFFEEFFTAPDNQAFLGFDLVMWIAETVSKHGLNGLISGSHHGFGLTSGFEIRPAFKEEAGKHSEMNTPLYYENALVRILKFQDQDFITVR